MRTSVLVRQIMYQQTKRWFFFCLYLSKCCCTIASYTYIPIRPQILVYMRQRIHHCQPICMFACFHFVSNWSHFGVISKVYTIFNTLTIQNLTVHTVLNGSYLHDLEIRNANVIDCSHSVSNSFVCPILLAKVQYFVSVFNCLAKIQWYKNM